jgi:hypothetical protein
VSDFERAGLFILKIPVIDFVSISLPIRFASDYSHQCSRAAD